MEDTEKGGTKRKGGRQAGRTRRVAKKNGGSLLSSVAVSAMNPPNMFASAFSLLTTGRRLKYF